MCRQHLSNYRGVALGMKNNPTLQKKCFHVDPQTPTNVLVCLVDLCSPDALSFNLLNLIARSVSCVLALLYPLQLWTRTLIHQHLSLW
jgi:hypothetical protein